MSKYIENEYGFERFVIGSVNENAYHMAKKFVSPSCDFQLLFLFGNIGMGKTHLAKAIEHELKEQKFSVKLMTSDQFVGEMIWHIGRNAENAGMEVFCEQYEKYDVLILDDIHFLEGKAITQKYFAYLLARLAMKQKKVLITSVKELSEYKWLHQALNKNVVQIEQVQIQDADAELKKKILEQLQKEWEREISQESIDLIVNKAKDIRELEGCFKKMMAYFILLGVDDEIEIQFDE